MSSAAEPLLKENRVAAIDTSNQRSASLRASSPVSSTEAEAKLVRELPDLTDRIREYGLTEEYTAFKDRYLAWRKGEVVGAKGEITADRITRPAHVAANRGFGYWYPSVQEWLWRRTMSYWIAVTFFEGAIFFMISSFLFNHKEELNDFYDPMTVYGYIAGKIMFFTCCYLMCLEVINLGTSDMLDTVADGDGGSGGELEPFYLWPYRYRTAMDRLAKAGCTAWPYYTASLYLTGVFGFTVGLVVEFTPGLPEDVVSFIKLWSFLFGSVLFAGGGFCECVQNRVFTSLNLGKGWFGALFNLIGGGVFTWGSWLAWTDTVASCNAFGWGSAIYMLSSSIQIIMWKDEQFGLTFFVVLNQLQRGAIAANNPNGEDHHSRFSIWGALFVHIYCWCGAMSTYNFNIEMKRYMEVGSMRSFQMAFNEFLPCVFAHMMLALNAAVVRTPKQAPFRQLYLGSRFIGVLLATNCTYTFYLFLHHMTKM